MIDLRIGDCLAVMPTLPENGIDTIITDPPYGLDFMGKAWDHGVPGVEFWQAALRVAKPGAILMAFGGTRTFHRLACAIEDAGWEIRDCMMWLYGSGFPKALNIGKAIDKEAGVERNVAPHTRVDTGFRFQSGGTESLPPTTDAAKLWSGYGTALKPAWEPIIVAMKPLEGTYAENAQKWGVAGLNIDGGRIASNDGFEKAWDKPVSTNIGAKGGTYISEGAQHRVDISGNRPIGGRWPANLLLNEDSARLLDEQSGGASRFFYTAKASSSERNAGLEGVMTWESVDLKEDLQKVLSLVRDTSDVLIPLQDGSAWRTILYGSNTTDPSLLAMKSTIETVTSLITGLRTSNFCLTSTTRDSILDAIRTLTADGSSLASIVDRLSRLILNTTNEQTVSALGAVLAVLRTLLPISEKGRHGNIHSTVKPVDLMRYLCKLTRTPTGGVVLDPFMGSGTTGIACVLEHRDFIGIELNAEYAEIARKRIADMGGPLFAEAA